jgi:Rha family phage regulatory protein
MNQVQQQVPENDSQIEIVDGMVSSLQVAEKFKKDHKNVIRDVDFILSTVDMEKDRLKFEQIYVKSTYQDKYGRSQPQYLMTRDGFSLIAMGFTGAEALKWKLKFIQAFNAMEAKLKDIQADPFVVMSGMTSEQVALFLESVKVREAAQREAAAAQAKLAIESAEKERAVTVAINSTKETALLTAKDDVWFSLTVGCKILGLKPKKALEYLRSIGLLNKDNMPSSKLLQASVEVVRPVATYADV